MSVPKFGQDPFDAFWAATQAGTFERAFNAFRSINYLKDTVDFVLDPDSYYVPNIRGDMLVKPKYTDEDAIMQVTVDMTRNRYFVADNALHNMQIDALQARDIGSRLIDSLNDGFRVHNRATPIVGKNVTAITAASQLSLNDTVRISSKPSVLVNEHASYDDDGACPSAVLHELVHVAQYLSKPMEVDEAGLEKELEAYYVQATILSDFSFPYSGNLAMAAHVDNIRRKHLDIANFTPTDELIDAYSSDTSTQQLLS